MAVVNPISEDNEPEALLSRDVGLRIRKIRNAKKLSLRDLARRCGTNLQNIQRLETGGTRITVEWIYVICNGLEIPPGSLFCDGQTEEWALATKMHSEVSNLIMRLQAFQRNLASLSPSKT